MKTFKFYSIFVIAILLISSCAKDDIKRQSGSPGTTSINSWAGRDTVNCNDQNSLEYSFLLMLKRMDVPGIDTIFQMELGDSMHTYFKKQFILADSIGIPAYWLAKVGSSIPTNFYNEFEYLKDFAEENYNSQYYASLVDSIINDYIIDTRFNSAQKNALSTYLLTTSTWWQIDNCSEGDFEVRNGDDGMLCNYTASCRLKNIFEGAATGVIVAFVLIVTDVLYPSHGATYAEYAAAGAFLAILFDVNQCGACDDCHHPTLISYQVDYTNCRIYSARFYGSFEYAEGWEFEVNAFSGNFHGNNTLEPRAYFPITFDPDGHPWVITARTVCDGGSYPDDDDEGFSQTFDGKIPATPLSIRGAVIANREDNFKYYTSTNFNGNLHDPDWEVSEDVDIISYGVEGSTYYIIVNFSEVTTSRCEIILTLYDDCHDDNIEQIKSIRLDHE